MLLLTYFVNASFDAVNIVYVTMPLSLCYMATSIFGYIYGLQIRVYVLQPGSNFYNPYAALAYKQCHDHASAIDY